MIFLRNSSPVIGDENMPNVPSVAPAWPSADVVAQQSVVVGGRGAAYDPRISVTQNQLLVSHRPLANHVQAYLEEQDDGRRPESARI